MIPFTWRKCDFQSFRLKQISYFMKIVRCALTISNAKENQMAQLQHEWTTEQLITWTCPTWLIPFDAVETIKNRNTDNIHISLIIGWFQCLRRWRLYRCEWVRESEKFDCRIQTKRCQWIRIQYTTYGSINTNAWCLCIAMQLYESRDIFRTKSIWWRRPSLLRSPMFSDSRDSHRLHHHLHL